jgi:hypothetical protein
LTTGKAGLKYGKFANRQLEMRAMVPQMNPSQNPPIPNQPSEKTSMEKVCRHPRVRVVAREDDAEFVECQECGDVFEASEFKDMAIEENLETDEA